MRADGSDDLNVANAVAWLLCKQAAFVTGQCFMVDWQAHHRHPHSDRDSSNDRLKAHSSTGSVIGASWTALFLAAGRSASRLRRRSDVEKSVRDYADAHGPRFRNWASSRRRSRRGDVHRERPKPSRRRVVRHLRKRPRKDRCQAPALQEHRGQVAKDAVDDLGFPASPLSEMQAGWRNPSASCSAIPSTSAA